MIARCKEGAKEMIKTGDMKDPFSHPRPGEWIEVEDVPHPPQWLWKLGLWGVFAVGILLGIVLAG